MNHEDEAAMDVFEEINYYFVSGDTYQALWTPEFNNEQKKEKEKIMREMSIFFSYSRSLSKTSLLP